ncbi:MAG: Uma2 family endonuclease [Cyanobacteria bacterium P01_G01_bin.54]
MVQTPLAPQILYPDSDGKPLADNTEQYEWIVRLATNLKHLLKDEIAFVAGDLQWYPVEVEERPTPCQAPDVMVVLGRFPGYRGRYQQWKEENIPPQVVFEVLSPSNTRQEMSQKQKFYEDHGVLEAYYYDPKRRDFWGYVRSTLDEVPTLITALYLPWVSPLLQIRFELSEDGLQIFYPNGEPFQEPEMGLLERDRARLAQQQALQERDQALVREEQVQAERDQAQQERDRAFAKLKELGIDPDTL